MESDMSFSLLEALEMCPFPKELKFVAAPSETAVRLCSLLERVPSPGNVTLQGGASAFEV